MLPTNPAAWNSWKDSLLRDLFNATRRALIRGLENPLAQDELILEKQSAALHQLLLKNIPKDAIKRLWSTFTKEYFLTHSPNAIQRHTKAIVLTPKTELPLIQMRQTEKRGGSEVLIYCLDRDNLFAVTTTMLDQLALSIVNARVMSTSDGYSLNSYLVLEQDGSPVELGSRSDEVTNTLCDGLRLEGTQPFKVTRRIPRKNKHFDHKTYIYFTQEPKLQRTTMRLVTLDRPGLLSNVGQAFAQCKIRLKHSKITTLGAQVEEIFFITDRSDKPILDAERLNCIHDAVKEKMLD